MLLLLVAVVSGASTVALCQPDALGRYRLANVGAAMVPARLLQGASYPSTLWIDRDGDGYGDPAGTVVRCPTQGFVPVATDCDDTDPAVNAAAVEIVADGMDQDCDGSDALRRWLTVPSFGVGWTFTGGAGASSVDRLDLPAGSGASKVISLLGTRGPLWLVVDVETKAGGSCRVDVTASAAGGPATETHWITASGTQAFELAKLPAPPRTLSSVAFSCPGKGSMSVDWFSLQNAGDVVVPPIRDVGVRWSDMNTTGVGGSFGVTRSADDAYLLSTSDACGVGILDLLEEPRTWRAANGSGDAGLPMPPVWDVAGVQWDEAPELEIWALMAELSGHETVGGLWYSADGGASWGEVANSQIEGIGAVAEENACFDSPDKDLRSGALLVPDGHSEDLWIGSNAHTASYDLDTDPALVMDGGVRLIDRAGDQPWTGLCPTLVPGLPPDQFISAMALAASEDTPWLVVGYRGDAEDALFLCALPSDAADPTLPDVDCANLGTVTCFPVPDAAGIDVADIEVDPFDPGALYVSDGGDRLDGDKLYCNTTGGGVFEVLLTGDPETTVVTDISDPDWAFDRYGVSGTAMAPDGSFLLAFLPDQSSTIYGAGSTVYRLDTAALGEGAQWTPVSDYDADGDGIYFGDPADYADGSHWDTSLAAEARRAATNYDGTWYSPQANTLATPFPEPELFTPDEQQAMDGIWWVEETDDGSVVQHALIGTRSGLWDVLGLDDSRAGWRGSFDTTWEYGPKPDPDEPWGYHGTGGGRQMVVDGQGNVWTGSQDLLVYVVPDGGLGAERDCVFERTGGAGRGVAVGREDDTVWAVQGDQTAGDVPDEIYVWRTVNHGQDWTFQSTSAEIGTGRRSPENGVSCRGRHPDYHWRVAMPMDGPGGGYALTFDPEAGREVPSAEAGDPSYGSPTGIVALNADIAAVVFHSYTSAVWGPVAGRLAYTLDGGATWREAEFDGGASACDAYQFFAGGGVWLTLMSGDSATWELDVAMASPHSTSVSEECELATVHLDSAGASWEWFTLPHAEAGESPSCRVDGDALEGVVASPWSHELFTWGWYRRDADGEWGGVCVLDPDTGGWSKVFGPADSDHAYELDVGGVAPHPQVYGLLLVSTGITPGSMVQCSGTATKEEVCPAVARPLLVQGGGSTWQVTPIRNAPGALTGRAVAWPDASDATFYYGTIGQGLWRGELYW